jgi:predicted RNA binding protein YcfA (HicA-like mRNA interferase family)
MTRLPILRAKQVLAAFERAGYTVVRVKGTHYQLRNPANGRRVTVPLHGGDVTRATLNSILSQSGLSVDDFLKLV